MFYFHFVFHFNSIVKTLVQVGNENRITKKNTKNLYLRLYQRVFMYREIFKGDKVIFTQNAFELLFGDIFWDT